MSNTIPEIIPYVPPKHVKDLLDSLYALPKVKKALDFIKEDDDFILKQQLELVQIEAPTFNEETRAKAYAAKLKEFGLADAAVDKYFNAYGVRKGTGGGPTIVVEGHLDTVFPFGTVKEPIIAEDGKIYCPGICDNTRGIAGVLGVLRGLEAAGIKTKGDIVFMGTSAEEGTGGLTGIRKYLDDHDNVDACICIDSSGRERVTYQATGIQTMAVTFHGIGGHAAGAYSKVANPLSAAARAVAKIADMVVPEDPRTTIAVTNFHAGNDAGIHAIVPEAQIKLNFRSNGQQELKNVEAAVIKAVEEACKEETERWGMDEITYTTETYISIPAGTQPIENAIVQGAATVIHSLGFEPMFGQGGSTNANIPVGRGIPAVCLGAGGQAGGIHTTDEWYLPDESYKAVQEIALLAMLMAGTEDTAPLK